MRANGKWLGLFSALCVLATLGGNAFAAEILRVGKANSTSFVFALVDAGVQAGLFEKHGVTLEISSFQGGPRVQQALAGGNIDIGLGSGPDMAGIARGAPVKAVAAIFNGLDQVLVVNPASGYASIDDLKGKVFGASSPAALSGWLPRALAASKGWGEDSITLQTVTSHTAALALLETRQIDAMTVDPASALQGEKDGSLQVIFRFAEFMPEFPQYAIYATDDVIANKPETLRAFLAGWVETVAFARDNKQAVVTSIATATGIGEEFVSQVYDEVMPLYATDGRFGDKALAILLDSFVQNDVLDARPEPSGLVDTSLLP